MQSITPCQRKISDRFPVASFVVNVPPSRLFEIVCTTDARLLQSDNRKARNAQNFYTSRSGGLLRAAAGHATYLLPPEQLRRFAGKPRLYFALASYGSARGEDPRVSVAPGSTSDVPSIQLSADFTGRTLDRSRIRRGPADPRYGATGALLTWGGDALADRPHSKTLAARDYDDGLSPELWKGRADGRRPVTGAAAAPAPAPRPANLPPPGSAESYNDDAGLGETYGRAGRATAEPPGHEHAPARPAAATARPAYGRAVAEPPGFEDPPALRGARAPAAMAYGRPGGEPPGYEEPVAGRPAAAAGVAYGRGLGEPAGYEDASALRAPTVGRAAYGRASAGTRALEEPSGAEDGRDLAPTAPASNEVARLTDRLSAAPAMSDAVPGRGVDDGWQEEDDEADLASTPGTGSGEPLTIRRKFEILLPVSAYESGDQRYQAVLGSVEHDDPTHPAYQRLHHGLHWGIVLFTQRGGLLGRVLRACERRDAAQFRQTLGDADADQLLQVTGAESPDARLAPVGGALLWAEPWLERFRAAGRVPAFQAAQNEVAIEHYFDRNLGFATALGLDTDRALAMVFDRAIHMGLGGGRAFVLSAVSPLVDADARGRALRALGYTDLPSFQQATGLTPTDHFGTQTHAALLGALRGLGAASPVAIPSTTEALDRLVSAAAGRRFEERLRALRTSSAYNDSVQRVI
jgi:hypothetical protein